MQYLKIQRFRLANRGCLCWDVFSRSTWPSSLCWSFWSVPHLSTMWSSSRSRPAHRSRSRGLCSQRTSTPSWRRWAVVVTASCVRSNWLHLSVCSSVVPGQAAGLQGESGWFALLCWAPGGERRLWAALWQDRQETGLPVRWELVNVLESQKECRTHWKCFLMTNCRNSCRILKVESRLRPSGLFLEVIFGYVTAFAPSYEVFAASRLLVGLMNGGIGVVCFVLVQEYVGKSYWAMTGTNLEVHNLIQSQFSLFLVRWVGSDLLCRDTDQFVFCHWHHSVRCSGLLDPTVEESDHCRQLLWCPLLLVVCVSTSCMKILFSLDLKVIFIPKNEKQQQC